MIGRTARRTALLVLAGALAACQWPHAGEPLPRPDITAALPHPTPTRVLSPALDESTLGWVNRMIEAAMEVNEIPGFAVGIIQNGQVAYAQGYGVAERGTDRAMTSGTLAVASSLSAQFTAAAIMQLVAQDQVALDAPVTDYLPNFKVADSRYTAITVRHLLSNTSGLAPPDFANAYDYTRRTATAADLNRYIASLATRHLESAPTEADFTYSNDNWDLLAAIIEQVTDETYAAYVAEKIFEPTGMAHSTFYLNEADTARLTASHWVDAGGRPVSSRTPPDYDALHAAATGLVTNVDDLLAWAALHLDRGRRAGVQIVPAAAYDSMWAPQTVVDWELGGLFQQWGLGWALADEQGHRIAWWGGLNLGSNMMLFLAPDDDVAVVTLANATRESKWAPWYSYSVGYAILQLLLNVQIGGT